MTQGAVARSVGVSRAAVGQWEAGTHEPSTENLISVCKLLGLNIDATVNGEVALELYDQLVQGINQSKSDGGHVDLDKVQVEAQKFVDIAIVGSGHKIDYRFTEPEAGGTFFFMFADPMFQTQRPLTLVGKEDAYCINVCDDYMSPKFVRGERIYIDPSRKVKVGDFVILKSPHMYNINANTSTKGPDAFVCVIGKVRAMDVQSVTIERFNPPELMSVTLTERTTVDRICSLHELIAF